MPEIYNASGKKPRPSHGTKRSKRENIEDAETYSSVLKAAGPSGSFAAYRAKPEGVSFEVQHDEEPVLLLLRQHPIVNVGWIVIAILMLLGPLLLPYAPILGFLPGVFRLYAVIGWYLLVIGFIFERILMWYYNVYIVTDERIIDVDFFSLIYKRISEAKIENIEDITATSSGILQTVVDYGDVRIQTAAEIPQIEFESVPHPESVSKFLSEMLMQEEQEKLEGRVR